MESKKVEFFNKLSFVTLLLTLFVGFFFFIPFTSVTLEASKGFLYSIGILLSFFFWLIGRFGDGKFVIPKDKLIIIGLIIPIVFLIASLFSSSYYVSMFAGGFEIGTFGSMFVLFVIFFLSSIHFQSEKRFRAFINTILVGGLVLVLLAVTNLFIELNKFLPNFFTGISLGNLVGNWNNFALLLGVFVLLSILTLEFLNIKKIFKILNIILLILSMFLLILINFKLAWVLIGSFSVLIFVYSIITQYSKAKITKREKSKKKFPLIPLVIIFISFFLLISGNFLNNFVSNYVYINNQDIRPSLIATKEIAFQSIKNNPILGTGPNTFMIDWALWHPKNISQTIFWNIDFTNGYSLLATSLVTTGILGFISLLLFFVIYIMRSIQSIRIALQDKTLNYFIISILTISIYTWIAIVFYNPNIVILMLAFCSSGILVGILVYKEVVKVKTFSFLSNPRYNFFSILGLVILMVAIAYLVYVYISKFTSTIYFSKSLKGDNTIESLLYKEKVLLRAIALDKNDVYYSALSQVYLNQIGIVLNNKTMSLDVLKSDFQQLVNNIEQATEKSIHQNPQQYLNYMNLGNIYSVLANVSIPKSYESAIAAYDKALLFAPNNPAIPFAKASLEFLVKKDNAKAREFTKQALIIKPNYIDAIFLLAQIEANEGNMDEAIRQAEYGGQIAPNDPTVFFKIGLFRYDNNDFNGAISAFEKAVILDTKYLNARYMLSQSYKKIGRLDDALSQLNILSKMLPDNQDIKQAIISINESKEGKE